MPENVAERAVAEQLSDVRPELAGRYGAELPDARAAVLRRLWRGLTYDPLPWVARRSGGELELTDGRRLSGPVCDPFATDAPVKAVELDGSVYAHPAELMRALGFAGFAAELAGSVASLALSRAGAPAGPGPWEQRVVDGHPYHPCCRYRPGFSVAEELAYAPEHRPVVRLALAPVADARVTGEWPERLRDGGRVLLPVHPWQAEHVLAGRELQGGFDARPLMALRTLEPDAWPGVHVKTALSTRLTSSVRDISEYSVRGAAVVSGLLADVAGRLDGRLHVTRTLAAASGGSADLAAVLRESPSVHADASAGEEAIPVAALGRRDPAWVAEFARLALPVGLRMLELGVALEAHGQNLLAVVGPDGRPRRLVYRDLADVRISPARLAAHGIPVPPLTGRIVTDDPVALRRKLFGSLVSGALGPLAGSGPALAAAVGPVVDALPPSADTEALRSAELPVKALTLMRLRDEPGDAWAVLPNPLR
ncbi:hypothetical protein SRB5_05130 [Streptomyces sp. RB5]|uniref:Iron transporter n=1 Tax=Streptomyces smaragdinus TaxID=2585196 RepID=A0A7K0CAD3_9ACTN|nr:IucA/IucC family siderophore biosynthesis protein [Streptomyces smaragdinus]MQY10405.1 hypothetical protein [Streptomyces smaragdinus]